MLRIVLLVASILGTCFAGDYFTVRDKKLYDPNGVEFLIRGINNMHIPFDAFNQHKARASMPAVAATNSNTLRLVWRADLSAFTGMSIAYLDDLIQRAINNKMVVMLELHDATCSNDKNLLIKLANWYKTNSALLYKYKRYLLLNIANEWVFRILFWSFSLK
jgi:mannan endo-1,4-beta-mannosidase